MPDLMTDEEFFAAKPVMSDEEFMAAGAPSSSSFLPGVARSFAQGTSFGFSDEAEAATRALFAEREDGEDFTAAYRRHRDEVRGEIAAFETENPGLALAAEVAGSLTIPGAAGVRATTTLMRAGIPVASRAIPATMITGAAEGGLYGAGVANETSDIPMQALGGAGVGFAAGAVVPPLVRAGQRAVTAVRGAVAPESAAGRRIGQALTRDQLSQADLAGRVNRARALGRPAVPADFGASLRRELEVATQTPGPAAARAEALLMRRNATQIKRLSRDLVRGTGTDQQTVERAVAAKMAERQRIAEPLYRESHAFPLELSDDVMEAFNAATATPLGKQALARARRILNVEDFDQVPAMAKVDAWKQGIDDLVGVAVRAGKRNEARVLGELRNSVIDLVDEVNPVYKAAREAWSGPSAYIDAVDEGRGIMSSKVTAAQLKQQLAGLSDAEREGFKLGAVDSIITKLRSDAAEDPNLVKHLRSPEMQDKITALMPPDAAKRFREVLKIEDKMFRTATQSLKGSQTARRQAAIAEQEKQVKFLDALELVWNLGTANLKGLFISKTPAVGQAVKDRLIARQNEVIAQRLLGRDVSALVPRRVPAPQTGFRPVPAAIVANKPLQVDIRDDDVPGPNPPRQ